MLESKIYQHLSTVAAISAVVGIRIYPMFLPESPTFPALSYFRVNGGQINTLSGYATLENPHIQIDAWATSYDTVKDLAKKTHTAMNAGSGFSAVLISDMDLYEESIPCYRVMLDFSCWNRE